MTENIYADSRGGVDWPFIGILALILAASSGCVYFHRNTHHHNERSCVNEQGN